MVSLSTRCVDSFTLFTSVQRNNHKQRIHVYETDFYYELLSKMEVQYIVGKYVKSAVYCFPIIAIVVLTKSKLSINSVILILKIQILDKSFTSHAASQSHTFNQIIKLVNTL